MKKAKLQAKPKPTREAKFKELEQAAAEYVQAIKDLKRRLIPDTELNGLVSYPYYIPLSIMDAVKLAEGTGKYRKLTVLLPSADKFTLEAIKARGIYSPLEQGVAVACIPEGKPVWVIGANYGLHALAAATYTTQAVYAIEPQRLVHQVLTANTVINGVTNLLPIVGALDAEPGVMLVDSWALVGQPGEVNYGGHSIGFATKGDAIPVYSIDTANWGAPGFVWIDAEGMEEGIIRGGQRILSQARPVIYCEANWNARGILRAIQALERDPREYPGEALYRVYRHYPPLYPGSLAGSRMLLAVPEEQGIFQEALDALGLTPMLD